MSDQTHESTRSHVGEYLNEFGEHGGRFFADGLNITDARTAYAKILQAENESLRQQVAQAQRETEAMELVAQAAEARLQDVMKDAVQNSEPEPDEAPPQVRRSFEHGLTQFIRLKKDDDLGES